MYIFGENLKKYIFNNAVVCYTQHYTTLLFEKRNTKIIRNLSLTKLQEVYNCIRVAANE